MCIKDNYASYLELCHSQVQFIVYCHKSHPYYYHAGRTGRIVSFMPHCDTLRENWVDTCGNHSPDFFVVLSCPYLRIIALIS